MQHIVIIGGGLSSRLLLIQALCSAGNHSCHWTIIEKEDKERMGDAFCTGCDHHLLNVPAARVSAIAHLPDDLVEWLHKTGHHYTASSFIPRKLYKRYISETLESRIRECNMRKKIDFVHGEAIDLARKKVILQTGQSIPADRVILAIGNFPPAAPARDDSAYAGYPGYYASAWQPDLFRHLRPRDPVLIIGTGLTMVDVALLLHQRGHQRPILAVSTHGFTPMSHSPHESYPSFYHELEEHSTALGLFKVVRKHIRQASSMGLDGQSVIDTLRPHAHKIWQKLDNQEKSRFMDHLRYFWGIARHRMAPENAATIRTMLKTGQLRIIAGRIKSITAEGPCSFHMALFERGSRDLSHLYVNSIVNCMGPASNYASIQQPLVKNLFQKGLIRVDNLKLGIDCLADGTVIDRNGTPSTYLYTIGPPMKGILWETTAIPEIRGQAATLAGRLIPHVLSDF